MGDLQLTFFFDEIFFLPYYFGNNRHVFVFFNVILENFEIQFF